MKRFIIICLLFITSVGIFAVTNTYTSITPGGVWNDISGKQINAHGGCVLYDEGSYYWFGEDRTGSVTNGISCYKSTDLYNWVRVGLAFAPLGVERDDLNDFAPGRTLERPKVIYNKSTQKWVMWCHWENGVDYGQARVCVATSDKIDGPYTFYKTFRPNAHDSRDQTIFLDDDGSAYHFCSTDMNSNMNVSLLREDYLEPTLTENKILKSMQYEAPAIFKLGDIYYGLFSGCTGWDPNPGRTTYSTNILDGWTVGDNFAVDNLKEVSYNSQSAYVCKLEGLENAYIYIGDRWNSSNVGASNNVWLPLSMRSGYPSVRWYASWDLSVFTDMYRYKRAKSIIPGNVYSLLEKYSNRLVSKPTNGFTITDDNESINLNFTFIQTNAPYVYKIKDNKTGNFLESVFGTLRLNAESSAISQHWRFDLKQDGYFNITNLNDSKSLSVSGASTFNNTNLYLAKLASGLHQDFAVYFDSKNQNYEEADLFSLSYINDNLKIIKEQNTSTSIEDINPDAESDFTVYPTINNGSFCIKSDKIADSDPVEIQILQVGSGKLVYTKSVCFNDFSIPFELSGTLTNGLYLVHIKSNNSSVVKKMIVK